MSRLTQDGTADLVSRDQILRHARGQGNIDFPCSADHEQDWQPYPVDPYSAICDDHTYIHTYTWPAASTLNIWRWTPASPSRVDTIYYAFRRLRIFVVRVNHKLNYATIEIELCVRSRPVVRFRFYSFSGRIRRTRAPKDRA